MRRAVLFATNALHMMFRKVVAAKFEDFTLFSSQPFSVLIFLIMCYRRMFNVRYRESPRHAKVTLYENIMSMRM